MDRLSPRRASGSGRRMNKKNRSRLILGVLAVLLLAGAALFLFLDRPLADEEKARLKKTLTYRPGISVGGVDLSGLTYQQALELIEPVREEMQAEQTITLTYEDQSWELTAQKMGFDYNWDEQLENALFVGYQGSLVTRWSQSAASDLAFDVTFTYTEESVRAAVHDVVEEINHDPVEPYAEPNMGSGGKFIYHEGTPGMKTDENEVFTEVMSRIQNGDYATPIALKVTRTQPTGTVEDVKECTKLVSTAATEIIDDSPNRVYNIKKMAGIINAQVVQPGEEFSINALAGIRTEASGWKLAPGIENGTTTDQPGGGICQVSTTLYNAVLKADLKVTARQHHSWPSAYVAMGRDATISSYGPDFKFINTQKNPIYIFAYASNSQCYVEIYGKPLDYSIKLESVVTETIPAPSPKKTEDPTLDVGKQSTVSKTRNGYRVEVYKYYYRNGVQFDKVLDHRDYYKPFQGLVAVGTKPTPSPTPKPTVSATPPASSPTPLPSGG